MLGQKFGMTEQDWAIAKSLNLKPATVLYRLQKFKGDKEKALLPARTRVQKKAKTVGKARSTRLPEEIDKLLLEKAKRDGITVSELIAKAIIEYLATKS